MLDSGRIRLVLRLGEEGLGAGRTELDAGEERDDTDESCSPSAVVEESRAWQHSTRARPARVTTRQGQLRGRAGTDGVKPPHRGEGQEDGEVGCQFPVDAASAS